jgi:hypothetical protein
VTTCEEVVNLAETTGVALAVEGGRLAIRGDADDVARVAALAATVRDALVALLVAPAISPTHITTVGLIFNDPATGTVRTIPAGTPCRRLASPSSALMAGVKLDFAESWAANKNIERGYCLIWLDGMLRGVHFSDIEPLKGPQND